MSKELVEKVFKKVKDKFTYMSDIKQYDRMEQWDHWADAVEAGESFSDDCDGFAITCAELLLRKGAKPHEVALIICRLNNGEGHMVCGWSDEETTWILDNRSKAVHNWKFFPDYVWLSGMRLHEKGKWRRIR